MLHSALIQSFLSEDRREPAHWFTSEMQSDDHTPSKKVRHTDLRRDPDHYGGTSCVFLCRDYKCALQVASIASGQHPWTLKPFYCILHPLDLDSQGRITLDETHLLLEEKASCLVPAPHPIPLAITFEPELRYFLGDEGYEDLLNQVNNSSS